MSFLGIMGFVLMIALAIALMVNYPNQKDQQARVKAHGTDAMTPIGDTTMEWDFVAACRNDYEMKRPMRYLMRLMGELGQR